MVEKEITEELDQSGLTADPENVSINDGASPDRDESDEAAEVSTEETSTDSMAPENEVSDLKKELDETKDRLIRQAAEFQNYRRRTEQEKSQMVLFGKGIVIQQLLDVFDDFRRSIEAADQVESQSGDEDGTPYVSLKNGVELAYQKLMDELKKMDVEPIECVGAAFDENIHEAVMQQPVPADQEEGIVLTEIQRGYRLGDRVLRHAKVIVSSRAAEDA